MILPAQAEVVALAATAVWFAAGTMLALQGASARREYHHRIEAMRRNKPDLAPLRHRGRHRRPARRTLAAWWASTAPVDLDARVRSALSARAVVVVEPPAWLIAAPVRIDPALMGQPCRQLLSLSPGWRKVPAPEAVRAFEPERELVGAS